MGLDTPIYCIGCGYDIRANEGRCSECGREFDRADPRTFLRRPRRKWTRWLRRAGYFLLAVMLVLGAAWGWLYWEWRQEQNTLAKLKPYLMLAEKTGPPWLQTHLGTAGFVLDRTRAVSLVGMQVTDTWVARLRRFRYLRSLNLTLTAVTDAGLQHIEALSDLEELYLNHTQVTDAGLKHLRGLSGLQRLDLWDTQVTDAGLVHLKALSKLQVLSLQQTPVTDAGVEELRKALIHGCLIIR